MIKNPKLGQKVFYLDDREEVFRGKITQVFSGGIAVGIDNRWNISTPCIFPTKRHAEQYAFYSAVWRKTDSEISKLKTKREKYAAKLHKLRND